MKKLTTEDFIKKAKEVHGDKYDYSASVYTGNKNPIDIICPIHGKFTQSKASHHLDGSGCPHCGKAVGGRAAKDLSNAFKKREEDFIKKAKILNPSYDYSKVIYTGENKDVIITCPIHGDFEQTPHNHLIGNKCPKCSHIGFSNQEKEIVDYLKQIYNGTIEENNRTILAGKEIDIYLPEINIGIEYDGMYWHNNVNNYYKYEICRKQNIRLIQITEWEWVYNKEKIKQYLKDTLIETESKEFARKCTVKEITNEEYKNFTEENHLQSWAPASIKIGLFNKSNELLQIMSFSKSRFDNKEGFEMIRECSKNGYSIIGGKAKLLKYFEKKYNPQRLVSYCEKNKFTGKSYFSCGFKLINESEPGYYYYKNDRKFHRVTFQKHKLKDLLENFDENLSEWENMSNNGYCRMFDYGNFVFVKEY